MGLRAAVIVPAHNEARRIGPLLETLAPLATSGTWRVIVVCNGCTDGTEDLVRRWADIELSVIDVSSKTQALNEGDRLAGDLFPRLYCDADLRTDGASLEALAAVLDRSEVVAVGPEVAYGLEAASWVVRQYFAALESAPLSDWLGQHLVGRGLYGLNRAARARFQAFPEVIADDLFVDSVFTSEEKRVVESARVVIWVPQTLRELLRQEVRVAKGNHEYRTLSADGGDGDTRRRPPTPSSAWAAVRRLRGRDVVPVGVYVCVAVVSRLAAASRVRRGRQIHWR